MFGLGFGEIVLVLAVALVVLGPRKLPAVAKQLGRSLRELRRVAQDFQISLEQEADAQEQREGRRARAAAIAPTPEPISTESGDAGSDEEAGEVGRSTGTHPALTSTVEGGSPDRP